MFVAYSIKKQEKINIDDVVDLSDTFKCLNPCCKAEFYIKGINSDVVSKHFARKKSTKHIKGCLYSLFSSKYINNSDMFKADLFSIYESPLKKRNVQNKNPVIAKNAISTSVPRITTPKQLLNFCISNKLSTEYKDGITINDIIIDERNILFDSNFEGFNGLRMVVGHTHRFEKNKLYMYVSGTTKNNKTVKLNIVVSLSQEQLSEIVKYILETYNNSFANHAIAIYEIWESESKYNVKCSVSQKSNIIYKFGAE